MKIVSSFLFSESHEHNVLWTKLSCESECVDEWVAIQSPFTFRGELKKANIEEILAEKRFDLFRDRVKVITIQENLFEKLCSSHCEKEYFKVEFSSRAACWDYINSKYDDKDRVLVGDVDELIDFSDKSRRDEFFSICKEKENGIQFEQQKCWWDFGNFSPYPKFMPVHTLGTLRSGKTSFTHRNNNCERVITNNLLAMEYAYSFSAADNFKKLSSFAHDRYTRECIDEALELNSWHRSKERGENTGVFGRDPYDWFEQIEMTPQNTPMFVLENLDKLRVNTVNPDYAKIRVAMGIQPHPALNYGLMKNYRINKNYSYFK